MSQTEIIKDHLSRYGSITPLEALQEYGIMRLASRINDLKNEGFQIYSESVRSENRFGKTVVYSRYRKAD